MNRILMILLAAVLMVGCTELDNEYGGTHGSRSRKSINGMAALREVFARDGATVKDTKRLTQRTRAHDAIVWIPRRSGGIESETTQWLNRWLVQGGRTLIYVVPDSGSEADYFREARSLAPPDQRMAYRRRHAEALIERMNWQSARTSPKSNGWFALKPLAGDEPISSADGASKVSGPWNDLVADDDAVTIEWVASPYVESDGTPATAVPMWSPFNPTGPTQTGFGRPSGTVERSSTEVNYQPLMSATSGDIVARVTSPSWKDSQVVVVSAGSWLTNFSLAHPTGLALANRLVQQTRQVSTSEPMVVSFSTTSWDEIPIRKPSDEFAAPSGMEFLTTWPLSLVTIHGLIAGLIACLVMLPIFGRPRRLVGKDLANFGGHLDAVAALMSRRDSVGYAQARIREYQRIVRGDDTKGDEG